MKTNASPGTISALKWLLGFAGSALLFMLANRRVVDIAYNFVMWELAERWGTIVVVLAIALLPPLVYLILRLTGAPVLPPAILFAGSEGLKAPVAVTMLLVGALLVIPYGRTRYRYFAETSFQMRAWKAFDSQQFQKARSICTEYLSLYPQRRVGAAWSDPVCVPILKFTDNMGYVAAYLKRRPAPVVTEIDLMQLPVDYSMRGPGMDAARLVAGGRIASAEPSRTDDDE